MAIYHFSAQMISRSDGRSSVAAAAYRAGEKILDERTGIFSDYTRKNGVDYAEVLLPQNAPADWSERAILWNAVERSETRKNSQVAREIDIALPVELTADQQIELAKAFVTDFFVSKGMVADVCFHDLASNNPHIHVMLTTRGIDKDGNFGKKNRDWNDKKLLESWRKGWADYANAALERHGFNERIDHRTLAAQQIDRVPQMHLGPKRHSMLKKGKELYSVDEHYLSHRARDAAEEKIKEAELYSELESLDHEIIRLEHELRAEQQQAAELEARIAAAREAIDAAKSEEQRLTELSAELRAGVKDAEEAIGTAKSEITRLEGERTELENYKRKVSAEIQDRRIGGKEAQEILRNVKKQIEFAQKFNEQGFFSKHRTVSELTKQYERLKLELGTAEEGQRDLNLQIGTAEEGQRDLNERIERAKRKQQSLKQRIEQAEREQQDLDSCHNSLQNQLRENERDIKTLERWSQARLARDREEAKEQSKLMVQDEEDDHQDYFYDDDSYDYDDGIEDEYEPVSQPRSRPRM